MRWNKGCGFRVAVGLIFFWMIWSGCKSFKEQEEELPDSKHRGSINVSADESFKPIVDALVQVYESNYPGTKINVQYKPEADCLADFAVDSIRMIIATRGYSEDEREFLVDSMKTSPEKMVVARDAIAMIVHPLAPDSLFTMPEVIQLLKGEFNKTLIPVFDGVKATSTVRFVIDSVLRGDSLTPKAVGARSSEGVIDYVSKNPDAVGFIGVSWIGNPEDSSQLSFLKKVRLVAIESLDQPGKFVKPYQANIYVKRYPMVRDLVYMLKENHKGLGHGFASFMSGEIGQLIFRRAYLVPARLNLGVRPVKLRE
jgi:phosphate transport system substrate-binding protein